MNETIYLNDVLNEISMVFIVWGLTLVIFAFIEARYQSKNDNLLANPALKKAMKHYENRSTNLFMTNFFWIAAMTVYFLCLSEGSSFRFFPIAIAAIISLWCAIDSRK